jgi:hypothetical protein
MSCSNDSRKTRGWVPFALSKLYHLGLFSVVQKGTQWDPIGLAKTISLHYLINRTAETRTPVLDASQTPHNRFFALFFAEGICLYPLLKIWLVGLLREIAS